MFLLIHFIYCACWSLVINYKLIDLFFFCRCLSQPAPPPPLYIITPTYRRPEQLAEITRLGYTLKHVPNIYWLVIEDADKPTELVTKLLQKINVPFEHLVGN